MPTDRPEDPQAEDEALSHLYDLAERIVADITVISPDWCQIARDAYELAGHAEAKCRCLSNDLTR